MYIMEKIFKLLLTITFFLCFYLININAYAYIDIFASSNTYNSFINTFQDNISDNITDNSTDNITRLFQCNTCLCDNTTLTNDCQCNSCLNFNTEDEFYELDKEFGLNECSCSECIYDNITDTASCSACSCDNATVKNLKIKFKNATDFSRCDNETDIVKFPENTYLERCVRNYLNATRWPLSCSYASTVTQIQCNDERITSLEGIQQFKNLKLLNMGEKGTQVEDLMPLRNLKELQRLEIPNSNIKNIEFITRLPKLTALNLKGNQITDLTYFPYMYPLYQLSLDYQGPDYIRDITPLQYMNNSLQGLSLQGNKITDISPLANLKSLKYLSIRDNRITSLNALDNKTLLSGLDFSINLVTDLSPLAKNTALNVIYGSHNKITSLQPLDNLSLLSQAVFKHNFITDVSPLANKRKMKEIALDFNVINSVLPLKDIYITSDILSLSFTYNCIPEDDYRKIRFLYNIQDVHFENQCINYPPDDIFIDGETIVNEDLITGDVWITDNSTKKYHETIGSGCAIGYGYSNSHDIIILTAFLLLFMKIFKAVFKRRKP